MTEIKYVQAYLTSTTPDEEGNFYTPVFVPDNIKVKYPLTDTPIPVDYQGQALKYDWDNFKWTINTSTPLVEQLQTQQAIINTQATELKAQSERLDKISTQLAYTASASVSSPSTPPASNYTEADLTALLAQATDKISTSKEETSK